MVDLLTYRAVFDGAAAFAIPTYAVEVGCMQLSNIFTSCDTNLIVDFIYYISYYIEVVECFISTFHYLTMLVK